MKQLEMLYEGKAKQVFRTDDPEKIIIHYKDAATAFNNIKKATIENKGVLNNAISTLIFKELQKAGIKTHYIETINDRDQICRRVTIIPLEVIVRNIIAGSMAQRLGIEEGTQPSNTSVTSPLPLMRRKIPPSSTATIPAPSCPRCCSACRP